MARKALIIKSQREPKYRVRKHNRCKICGRPRGYMRDFEMCRVCFRKLASEGLIPGVTKSSW
ncbi:type Z 30S ribosomal protein S14 [Spirochaeta thermophila]|uniref:Small ribosomal subunit protein uS14 n=2 Tax=Winmispira thermophila TaxID=154 RepID=G0GFB2_WINT7|nr:type Z 30S ribosomal protein S14 [Spirochaeta thermophila]ADN01478.1 30S ribosomal protein S14 [Spirochaeta thermophila DSM 6192]AEJ60811.1 ribosomal protein S14 [Spirochaeta thermophila DSM 6578]